jgi:sarcosine oxidase, subunit alpha
MFTTTGGAASVLSWLECWHQTEWPELEVYFNSVTDHWVTVTVSGPNSRKVLQKVCHDIDFSKENFKFLEAKQGHVAGINARVFRISFTGELTYEINVPANYGDFVWQEVYQAGQIYNITPYGTETMHVLRAEKGFIIIGQDTDGSVTPSDLNMDWVVGKKKKFDFIGRRGLSQVDCLRADRKQLVGLKTKNAQLCLPEGGQLVNEPHDTNMQGHVSSSYYSATLGHSIALALVKAGLSRMGETVFCPLSDGSVIEAEIVSSVFYDVKGARQDVE